MGCRDGLPRDVTRAPFNATICVIPEIVAARASLPPADRTGDIDDGLTLDREASSPGTFEEAGTRSGDGNVAQPVRDRKTHLSVTKPTWLETGHLSCASSTSVHLAKQVDDQPSRQGQFDIL